jgi:hypothetical protein
MRQADNRIDVDEMLNEIIRLKNAGGMAFADFVLAAPADRPARRADLRRLEAEFERAEQKLALVRKRAAR